MKGKKLFRILCVFLCLVTLLGDIGLPALAAETAETEENSGELTMEERALEAKKQIRSSKVGRYGMVPIYGRDVEDGTYEIHVDSSSPFFKIIAAELIVKNHVMTARITISSLSYLYVYPGTAQEAESAPEDDYIGYVESDDHGVFTIPVEALDTGVPCAAFSKRRKRWYERTLVFYASSLPPETVHVVLPDYELIEAAIDAYETEEPENAAAARPLNIPEPMTLPRADGEYSIEVNMTGGSGRASISSPTLLIVRDGRAYARLLWSSPHYDYMIMEDQVYENLTVDGGNSTFEIPITAMDEGIPVIADTTAMGDPVEINYTLTFYEESIGPKGQIPQEAAKKVLYIAAVIILAGGVLNYFLKKKQK